MEVKIQKRFDLPVSAEQAWRLLCDVRETGSCMPGVQVTEEVAPGVFKGIMRTRIGPATMNFTGQVEVLDRDDADRSLRMVGKGGDTSGSSATMTLSARIEDGATTASSVLVGDTTVSVSGKLAQFGSRLLLPVSESMLRSFVGNFSGKAAALPVASEMDGEVPPAVSPRAPAAPPRLNIVLVAWQALGNWFAGLWRRGSK
jgi:carbon monoxide dehydrogenase subunit G